MLGTCNECRQTHFLSVTRQIAISAQPSLPAHPRSQFKWGDLENRTKLCRLFIKSVLFFSYNQGAIVHLFH